MSKVCGGLKDDCIREFDAARGAGGKEERVVQRGEGRGRTEKEAEGKGGGGAQGSEVAERHGGGRLEENVGEKDEGKRFDWVDVEVKLLSFEV